MDKGKWRKESCYKCNYRVKNWCHWGPPCVGENFKPSYPIVVVRSEYMAACSKFEFKNGRPDKPDY
jgi:hypothetical protein